MVTVTVICDGVTERFEGVTTAAELKEELGGGGRLRRDADEVFISRNVVLEEGASLTWFPRAVAAGAGVGATGVAALAHRETTPEVCRGILSVPSDFVLPATLAELQDYLAAAPSEAQRLPVLPFMYDKLNALDPALTAKLVYVCPSAETVAAAVTVALGSVGRPGTSELCLAVDMIGALLGKWVVDLCDWSRHPQLAKFTHNRGSRDISGGTSGNLMPDFLGWLDSCLVIKEEHKDEKHDIEVPIAELGAKVAMPWTLLTSGNLPYLLGVAVAGFTVQFCAVMRGTNQARPMLQAFNISKLEGRLQVMSVMASFTRLLPHLAPFCKAAKLQLGGVVTNGNGSIVHIKAKSVRKRVTWFKERINMTQDIKFLVKMYQDLAGLPYIIQAVALPTLEGETYLVDLSPLGWCHEPLMEAELKKQLNDILLGLIEMHRRGYLHRDLRKANLLRTSQGTYFIGDLEGCGHVDEPELGCRVAPELLVNGMYTAVSDLKMVGALFCGVANLSATGDDLRACLLSGSVLTAKQALAHPWFS